MRGMTLLRRRKRNNRQVKSRSLKPRPHSDKTSCAVGALPSMKMGSASYRAVNRLFSVDSETIFEAGDFTGLGSFVGVK